MGIRESIEYSNMNAYWACEIAEGFGSGEKATKEEYLAAWQYIADTGMCSYMKSFYGRTVFSLIEQGIISEPN